MTSARAAIGNRWGITLVAPLANRTRDQPERAKAVAGLVTLPPTKFVDGVGATEKVVDCCCNCAKLQERHGEDDGVNFASSCCALRCE